MIVNFYIKTKSINVDRRVQKMLKSIEKLGASTSLILSSNDQLHKGVLEVARIHRLNLIGGAAPVSMFKRLVGAIQFCLQSFSFTKRKPDANIHWINDPILFPLVLLLRRIDDSYIIWDHHELPPDWVLRNRFVRSLFRISYKSANCVIHTNHDRSDYLESVLDIQHPNKKVIPNYPEKSEINKGERVELRHQKPGQFVYLQNAIGNGRCDLEILKAIKSSGLGAVHAGNVDVNRINYLRNQLNGLDFCEFVGLRSLAEINYLLDNSMCTLIFYRNSSMNNWLCEPNRLYQAKLVGTPIVAGNNPTLSNALKGYPLGVTAATDGSDSEEISLAIQRLKDLVKFERCSDNVESNVYWDDYLSTIATILEEADNVAG